MIKYNTLYETRKVIATALEPDSWHDEDDYLLQNGQQRREAGLGPLVQGQRWTALRKREVVLHIFRGEPLELLSRELSVELYRLKKWRDAALAGMEEALKARNGDPLKTDLDHAMKRLVELTMENELLWARVRRPGPLVKRRSKK